eukprot:CAMPEP_0173397594 /NCGR_PEP_ID=MMETSP1356-20130122/38882_1 /TAXON_ID=77927 ORGANISM="Hemiselmis virescens, Strain PCC157" /NCGR_SAMPLE_ID=MMETSP1356 /ASSEMBLY_ACC=CAM_ASM_000847 /LENGTH=90 /DNA_ID=CAMNT_0014356879 /DNA_START=230 /DNA_END=499 /DNA_ORIENTATION=-
MERALRLDALLLGASGRSVEKLTPGSSQSSSLSFEIRERDGVWRDPTAVGVGEVTEGEFSRLSLLAGGFGGGAAPPSREPRILWLAAWLP